MSPTQPAEEVRALAIASVDNRLPEASEFKATLDAWAPKFLQRVFGAEASGQLLSDAQASGNWMNPPAGWRASSMIRLAFPDQKPVSTIPIATLTSETEYFPNQVPLDASLMVRIFGLFGLFLLTWWFGSRIVKSPSIWLMILGIVSIGFIPYPVTIAIVLLSLLGPFVPVPKTA